jgi:GR25 family glycosyltransferase involved in LPS biosynthesis
MSKYLGYFDAVYYINMDSRIDRKEKFEKVASELNIPAIRFSAITAKDEEALPLYPGHNDPRRKYKMGCTLSHQAIIQIAKNNGYQNCLIFEDDCIFLDKYVEKIQQCVDELKNIDWSLFYLGGQPNNYCKPVSDNLVEIENGGVYATHAYAINHTFYDKVLEIKPTQVDTIDILYLNYNLDVRKCILSKELLAVQDNSYSDLWDVVSNSSQYMIDGWNKYVINN